MTVTTTTATIFFLLFAKSSFAFTNSRIWGTSSTTAHILQSSPFGQDGDPSYYEEGAGVAPGQGGQQQEEDPSLILGDGVKSKLEQLKDKYPTNENAYLAAARQRSIDAKAKYLAEIEAEDRAAEEKRVQKAAEAEANMAQNSDYGPGDLSEFQGFEYDGFEASEGNDESGGWSELKEAPQEEEEGPSLFIPGGDDDGTGDSGLLLG